MRPGCTWYNVMISTTTTTTHTHTHTRPCVEVGCDPDPWAPQYHEYDEGHCRLWMVAGRPCHPLRALPIPPPPEDLWAGGFARVRSHLWCEWYYISPGHGPGGVLPTTAFQISGGHRMGALGSTVFQGAFTLGSYARGVDQVFVARDGSGGD